MSLTPSHMIAIGTEAPEFALCDVVTGDLVTLSQIGPRKGFLIMFICRHCPYVVHVQQELAKLGLEYVPKDIAIVAISANDPVRYPEDAPSHLKEMAEALKFNFPYCFDRTQEVARSYKATCTPDFYLFDGKKVLVYRGQLDDSRPGNGKPVTGKDLRAALDALLLGQAISADQKPSMGCGIKWKQG